MIIDVQEVITDSKILTNRCILRNGFSFTAITHPANVYDAIVVKYPQDVPCFSPRINGSSHSLKEQVEFINRYRIEKALIIAENIDFITMCPTLKHLRIIPLLSCSKYGIRFIFSFEGLTAGALFCNILFTEFTSEYSKKNKGWGAKN